MAYPVVKTAFFERIGGTGSTGWKVRLSVSGSGFVQRAAPLVGTVGDVRVEGLVPVDSGGAVGFLSTIPPAGAPLRIGYLDTGLVDTGLKFPAPPSA